jgi:hypothetical protein
LDRFIFILSSKDNKKDEFDSSTLNTLSPNHVNEVNPAKVLPYSFRMMINVFSILSHF